MAGYRGSLECRIVRNFRGAPVASALNFLAVLRGVHGLRDLAWMAGHGPAPHNGTSNLEAQWRRAMPCEESSSAVANRNCVRHRWDFANPRCDACDRAERPGAATRCNRTTDVDESGALLPSAIDRGSRSRRLDLVATGEAARSNRDTRIDTRADSRVVALAPRGALRIFTD